MGAAIPRSVALITGASSGIGASLAVEFARGGYDLVLVARRQERLQALAERLQREHGITSTVVVADLAQKGTTEEIARRVGALGRSIDVLVNNAGFGIHGDVATIPAPAELRLIDVNVTALVSLTKLVLPQMIQRRSGKILNVASTAAFVPGPFAASYYASKAFVVSFSEALYAETAGSGVTVTVLCPGPTDTEFADVAGRRPPQKLRRQMTADAVARAGYLGLKAGKRMVVPGLWNKALLWAAHFAPRGVVLRFIHRLNRPGV